MPIDTDAANFYLFVLYDLKLWRDINWNVSKTMKNINLQRVNKTVNDKITAQMNNF